MNGTTNFEFTVLLANKSGNSLYATIQASGESPHGQNTNCPGGLEQNVIWLKMDEKLKLLDSKSILINSCIENIHCPNGCEIDGKIFTAHFTHQDFKQNGTSFTSGNIISTLRYNNDYPDLGMILETNLTEPK